MIKKLFSIAVCLTIGFMARAQEVDMADAMRSSGKIYVVVACVVVLFIGILIYLIRLERKVSKIEGYQKENHK
jgi:predicted membrane channel-forming protein YqfA (hemolysin III family)